MGQIVASFVPIVVLILLLLLVVVVIFYRQRKQRQFQQELLKQLQRGASQKLSSKEREVAELLIKKGRLSAIERMKELHPQLTLQQATERVDQLKQQLMKQRVYSHR